MSTQGPLNPHPGHPIRHFGPDEPGISRQINLVRDAREEIRQGISQNSRIQEAGQQAIEANSSVRSTSSETKINARPLSSSNWSLNVLASKIMNWLATSKLFLCIKNVLNSLFGSRVSPQEQPLTEQILDKLGNKENENTWSKHFTIESKNQEVFNGTLRNFPKSVKNYDTTIGQRLFRLAINGDVIEPGNKELADEKLKAFFGNQFNQSNPSEVTPLNIAKFYITNGLNNFVDDNKLLPDEAFARSEEANWLLDNSIIVNQQPLPECQINFIKRQESDPPNVFKFETIEEASIGKFNSFDGTIEPIAKCTVTKEYVVTRNDDGTCTIEGKKTIKTHD